MLHNIPHSDYAFQSPTFESTGNESDSNSSMKESRRWNMSFSCEDALCGRVGTSCISDFKEVCKRRKSLVKGEERYSKGWLCGTLAEPKKVLKDEQVTSSWLAASSFASFGHP
jgi:hypothetical protein